MRWEEFKHKKVGIFGLGREGKAALACLEKYAPTAQIVLISENNVADLDGCDCLIKSPGVSLYRDEIRRFRENGGRVTSCANLFFANRQGAARVLAVTGTKGKSTTASLLAHALSGFGFKTLLGGNIGRPLTDFLEEKADFIVAELSSYQCADLTAPGLEACLLTNLYPEHLPWHGSHARYYDDKCRLARQAKIRLLNALNDETRTRFQNDSNARFFNTPDGFHVKDGFFCHKTEVLFETDALPLKGEHNAQNACAVLAMLDALNLAPEKAKEAFSTFRALPHRLQEIGRVDGLAFVDDSISTTPETAEAALRAFDAGQALTLIAGGEDRGQNFAPLMRYAAALGPRFCLITLPETGARMAREAARAGVTHAPAATMAEAVRLAKQKTPAGGTVLLSPAAPSYNAYRNFEERGEDFKTEALRLSSVLRRCRQNRRDN